MLIWGRSTPTEVEDLGLGRTRTRSIAEDPEPLRDLGVYSATFFLKVGRIVIVSKCLPVYDGCQRRNQEAAQAGAVLGD